MFSLYQIFRFKMFTTYCRILFFFGDHPSLFKIRIHFLRNTVFFGNLKDHKYYILLNITQNKKTKTLEAFGKNMTKIKL